MVVTQDRSEKDSVERVLRASMSGSAACQEMKKCVIGVGRCMSNAEANMQRPEVCADIGV
jgi:hypothetical protein